MVNFEKKKLWRDTLLKVLPVPFFVYACMSKILPKNTFLLDQKTDLKTASIKNRKEKCQPIKFKAVKKKIILDIKKHKLQKNWNKESVTYIISNEEGKIIGYKYLNIFYPNYYSEKQPNKIIKKDKIIKNKIKNIYLMKIKYH